MRQEGPEPKGAVGLSVATNGMPGELGVYGFALRGERERPAYVALNFNDTATLRSSNTVFAGVPVGEADVLPGDHFIPEIALANFGLQPATATVLYATSGAGGAAGKTVAEITLAPQSSTTVRLPGLQGDPQMRNSFVVQSKAPAGSLAANLIAVGGATFRTVQLIGKDENGMNGGSHPWTLESGSRSTLLLFNPTNSSGNFDVRVAAQGVLWVRRYQLDSLETKAIDIGVLISGGEKDGKGKTLPKGANVGEVNWSTDSSGQGNGRMLVSQPERTLARNFSCGTQVGMCGIGPSISVLDVLIDSTGDMGPAIAQMCIQPFPVGGCGGTYDYSNGGSGTWTSQNTSIATVGSTGTVTGVGGGLAYIDLVYNSGKCTFEGQGQAPVQVPTSLKVMSAKALPPSNTYGMGCPPGDYGFEIDIVYQVLDQKGNAIQSSSMEPQEKDLNFVFNGTSEGNPEPNWVDIMGGTSEITKGRKFTEGNGTFEDAPFGVCALGPFTATYTQPISVLVGTNRHTVRTNNWTQTGTAPAKGTTTNKVDITVSQ